jgi:hypothetical protein
VKLPNTTTAMPDYCYDETGELAGIAQPIVEQYHAHLLGLPIRWVWQSEHRRARGRIVWADASVITGQWADLTLTPDEVEMLNVYGVEKRALFLIRVAADIWHGLSAAERAALVDHELMHCAVEERETGLQLVLRGHDVEEFEDIVRRHGLWTDDLVTFGAAALGFEGDG